MSPLLRYGTVALRIAPLPVTGVEGLLSLLLCVLFRLCLDGNLGKAGFLEPYTIRFHESDMSAYALGRSTVVTLRSASVITQRRSPWR